MSTHQTVKVAVLGASGYTGGELLRLLAAHPRMEVTVVTAEKSVGATLSSTFPYLASVLPPLTLEPVEIDSIADTCRCSLLGSAAYKIIERRRGIRTRRQICGRFERGLSIKKSRGVRALVSHRP